MLTKIISQANVDHAEKWFEKADKIVIVSHVSPDGDAIGSSLGLYHFLNTQSKTVNVIVPNQFPDFLRWMPGAKDVIISGGENLYPVQIEDFLRANPAVKDVAVIGLPDPRLGEIAAAIVSVKEGMSLSEDDVNDFCLALPRYKRPRKIIFAEVPRNPTGKIEKPLLRKCYGADALVAQQNGIPA